MKGKVDLNKLKKSITKKYGDDITGGLGGVDKRVEFLPTGSRWLDSIVCGGRMGGWPIGRVVEIAGEPASGKSFIAAVGMEIAIASGWTPVLFDIERSWNKEFMEKVGFTHEDILYTQPKDLETLFDIVEECLDTGNRWFFVWDSLASTSARGELEVGLDIERTVGLRARKLSRAWNMYGPRLSDTESVFLTLNQLYTKIGQSQYRVPMNAITDGDGVWYTTAGGMKALHGYSMRVFLLPKRSRKNKIKNEGLTVSTGGGARDKSGLQVGHNIRARIVKNRFGPPERECTFALQYGGGVVRIQDEESWADAITTHEGFSRGRGRSPNTLTVGGKEFSWMDADWTRKLASDPEFEKAVKAAMDYELIHKMVEEEEEEEKEEKGGDE